MQDELYLLLGCFGCKDDGFVTCPGVENRILKPGSHIEQYNEMMNYFDACRLFDRPMFEYSAIAHFIKNMQDKFDQVAVGKRLWSERQYNLFQKFIQNHRICGLYIKLIKVNPAEDTVIEREEKGVVIKAINIKPSNIPPKIDLRFVRGRRKNS